MKLLTNGRKSCFKLLKGIAPETFYNLNGTGLFFKTANNKTLFHKEKKCSGGKKSMALMLCMALMMCKNDRRKENAPSDLEVTKSKVFQDCLFQDFMFCLFQDWFKKVGRKMGHQTGYF